MTRFFLSICCLFLGWAGSLQAHEALVPRHPAPSPDGTTIAFSWQGDIWRVGTDGGEARRLTVHPALDRLPIWSRDGQWIAFASDRAGNLDIYVMAADGTAPPRRLTYASTDDRPADFTPDGKAVLFVSRRDESFRRNTALYTVSVEGGTPRLAQDALTLTAAYSPDGQTLALVRGSTRWTRRGYRGSANRDLWLAKDGKYEAVTDFDGDDDAPGWVDADHLIFLSSRAGRKNVFRLDLATKAAEQLTFHDGSDVRYPRVSADGRLVAYEFEDGLWTVPSAGGEARRLSLQVPADSLADNLVRRADVDGATELAVHPSGELAAFIVHGDVFVTAILSKDDQEIAPPATVQVTRSQQREAGLAWSPDGETLLVSTYSQGSGDILRIRRPNTETPWTETFQFTSDILVQSPEEERGVRFSPDGKRIAFRRGLGKLVLANADGGAERVLLNHWTEPAFDWSPDGKWLAYSVPDPAFNSDIWLQSAEGGEPYNVSRHPDDDEAPRFTPDGRRLIWLSKRHDDTVDLWSVWLRRDDYEKSAADWLREIKKSDEGKDGANKKDEEGKEEGEAEEDTEEEAEKPKELPEVRIDFDRLWERAAALTELKGDEEEPVPATDSRRIYFIAEHQGERDLYSIRWDGKDLKRLTEGGTEPRAVQFSQDGKTLFFINQRRQLQRIDPEGKPGDPLPFVARYEVDRQAEATATFEEVWQALNDNFYDPNFHGVDWAAQRLRYRPWALAASHPADFADIVNLMLGELNASHMGYFLRDEDEVETTGWIGALFDVAAGGPGLLVREVLTDSPASKLAVNLQPGERILAVNGTAVDEGTNLYGLFADTVGQRVLLRIRGALLAERDAVVLPVRFGDEQQLRYLQWTHQRRQIVERTSGGRLGYLHIQGMDIPSYEEFEHDLYAAGNGKEGLVIDVRSNGGGWTTDYLMAALNVRRHARTVPRGGDPSVKAYPQSRLPLAAWTRPAVALCDQDSYSNAEIFSWAFQTLGRGKLVGFPTFGAVISTGGTPLLNGGFVRLPFRGWYVAGSDINMELNGAVPDVIVPAPPTDDFAADSDAQLERAVEVLLKELETDPRAGAW
jgi:tricorn protease